MFSSLLKDALAIAILFLLSAVPPPSLVTLSTTSTVSDIQTGFTLTVDLKHFAFFGIKLQTDLSWVVFLLCCLELEMLHDSRWQKSNVVCGVEVFKHGVKVSLNSGSFFFDCCITQSIIKSNKNPDMYQHCFTPIKTGKGTVVSLSSTTEHWKPSYSTNPFGSVYLYTVLSHENPKLSLWTESNAFSKSTK